MDYDSLKTSYDKNARLRNKSEIQEWKKDDINMFYGLIEFEGKETLLDLGAGAGHQAKIIADRGMDVCCIDISTENVKSCSEKGLKALEMNFLELDFEDEAFDSAWAMNSLLHVPKKELPKVLKEIKRVLKKGGLFYMGVYGGKNSEGIYEKDFYEPKRFFALYEDEDIKKILEQYFEIINFENKKLETHELGYQRIVMRKVD